MRIVPRSESGLKPAKQQLPKMKLPAKEVWIHHTVTPVTNDPFADWRLVQNVAFGRDFTDISYSYGIHPNGTILEGRGDSVGAHTQGRNSTSYGVVLIGNYETTAVPQVMVEAVQWLMGWLEDNGKVKSGTYPTGGHRDVGQTACPGRHAYALIPKMREPLIISEPAREGVIVVNRPPVKLLTHPSWNGGYIIITDDGGVFSFEAPFHGSLGELKLNSPIVDAEVTPSGGGYWMLGADGGIFSFGDAAFKGRVEYSG